MVFGVPKGKLGLEIRAKLMAEFNVERSEILRLSLERANKSPGLMTKTTVVAKTAKIPITIKSSKRVNPHTIYFLEIDGWILYNLFGVGVNPPKLHCFIVTLFHCFTLYIFII